MIYKLASRDNISEKIESWPAVLNASFTKFNNAVVPHIFRSEDDILNWLESKSRTKSSNRHTNVQEFRNGDPNKLYSIYLCNHEDPNHTPDSDNGPELQDKFMYSLRRRRAHEAYMSFNNEKGARVKSSFKKIDTKVEYGPLVSDSNKFGTTSSFRSNGIIDYSSEPRLINGSYYEGIYPFEIKENEDAIKKRYMQYVNSVHNMDTDENKLKDYSVIYIDDSNRKDFERNGQGVKLLDTFIKKLIHVENFLEFFAKGGNSQIGIEKDPEHDSMISYIFQLMEENRQDTEEDNRLQQKVRNMIVDPYLCSSEIFQVRVDKTLLSWHRNYVHMIKELAFIPSKRFVDLIMNFSIVDFYKQYHSKENLMTMIRNLEEFYGVDKRNTQTINYIKNRLKSDPNKTKFHKVVRAFNID
jgi:hypothetical protein